MNLLEKYKGIYRYPFENETHFHKTVMNQLQDMGYQELNKEDLYNSDRLNICHKILKNKIILLNQDIKSKILEKNKNLDFDKLVDEVIGKLISETRIIHNLGQSELNKKLRKNFHIFKRGFYFKKESISSNTFIFKLIDWNNIDNNHFGYVHEKPVIEKIRFDLIIYLNGIPTIPIECKYPSLDSINENSYKELQIEAANQLLNVYKQKSPNSFAFCSFVIAAPPEYAKVHSATSTGSKQTSTYFYKSRFGNKASIEEENQRYCFYRLADSLLNKKTLLRIINEFIFYNSENVSIFPRNHQYHSAINEIIPVFRSLKINKGKTKTIVINDPTGTGKSLVFVYLFKQLQIHLPEYHWIFMADRIELQSQGEEEIIKATKWGYLDPFQKIENMKDLLNKLENWKNYSKPYRFSINIQKFQIDPKTKINEKNIIIVCDEAHRSHKEDATDNHKSYRETIMEIFPRAIYLGLTATPKHKTKDQFGENTNTITYADSIRDEYIVAYHYENVHHNAAFKKNIPKPSSIKPQTINELKKELTIKDVIYLQPEMIKNIVSFIVEKFLYHNMELKSDECDVPDSNKRKVAKALVGLFSPTHQAKKYYDVLQKDYPEVYKRSCFISTKENHAYNINSKDGITSEELKRRFKERDSGIDIAFVIDMCSTGYNNPYIDQIYIIKQLSELSFIQLIARSNRVFKTKKYAYIYDFFGPHNEKYMEIFGKERFAGSQKTKKVVSNYKVKDLENCYKQIVDLFNDNHIDYFLNDLILETKNIRILVEKLLKQEKTIIGKIKFLFNEYKKRFKHLISKDKESIDQKYKIMYQLTLTFSYMLYNNTKNIRDTEALRKVIEQLVEIDMKAIISETDILYEEMREMEKKQKRLFAEKERLENDIVKWPTQTKDFNEKTYLERMEAYEKYLATETTTISEEEIKKEIKDIIDKYNNQHISAEETIKRIINLQNAYIEVEKKYDFSPYESKLKNLFEWKEEFKGFTLESFKSLTSELLGFLKHTSGNEGFGYFNLGSMKVKNKICSKIEKVLSSYGIERENQGLYDEIYNVFIEIQKDWRANN